MVQPKKAYMSVVRMFEKQVLHHPDSLAVQGNAENYTYEELNRIANDICCAITELSTYSPSKILAQPAILKERELQRYSRQMLLEGWGGSSQEKLKNATVFVAGAGGSGSPILTQLALLGVGHIIVADFDQVELSNLNRQFIHDETRLGQNKAASAKKTIKKINPHVQVTCYEEKITRDNAKEMIGKSSIIFDNVDDLETKYHISQISIEKGIPHIISSVMDTTGYCAILHSPITPCFHCLNDIEVLKQSQKIGEKMLSTTNKTIPSMASSLFGVTGFIVTEAIKILIGHDNPAYNKYFLFNHKGGKKITETKGYKLVTYSFTNHFKKISKKHGFDWDKGWCGNFLEEIPISPDPTCPACRHKHEQSSPKNSKTRIGELPEQIVLTAPLKPLLGQECHCAIESNKHAVSIFLGHEPQMIAAIIGVLKAGKAYVPLDPLYPEERLRYMIENSRSSVVITNNRHYGTAQRIANQAEQPISLINLDVIETDQSSDSLHSNITEESIAYILYTSGSTGLPKGVAQNHRYLSNMADTFSQSLQIRNTDRLTLLPSFSFSASIMDMFGALINGASLHLFNARKNHLQSLVEMIERERITIYHSVPTLLRSLLNHTSPAKKNHHLRIIYLAGEPLYSIDARRCLAYLGKLGVIVNGLGCTEFNICRQYRINHETQLNQSIVPVGYEVAGVEIAILDPQGHQVKPGETGEIAIISKFLPKGYWRSPMGDQDKFITLKGRNETVFLSGDMGQLSLGKCLTHMGRKDFQVKIRGYRIETSEIENALLEHPAVKEAAVVCSRDSNQENHLTAYLVSHADTKLYEINQFLRTKLPRYMLPRRLVKTEALPLTPSGKLDRKRLIAIATEGKVLASKTLGGKPKEITERILKEIWQEAIGCKDVGVNDNFFDVGGDSLMIHQVHAAIRDQLNVTSSIVDLYKHPTIRTIAQHIRVLQQDEHT